MLLSRHKLLWLSIFWATFGGNWAIFILTSVVTLIRVVSYRHISICKFLLRSSGFRPIHTTRRRIYCGLQQINSVSTEKRTLLILDTVGNGTADYSYYDWDFS